MFGLARTTTVIRPLKKADFERLVREPYRHPDGLRQQLTAELAAQGFVVGKEPMMPEGRDFPFSMPNTS